MGRHPLVTCFLQRLRPPARKLFHSLESSALPFPGDQDSLLRDTDPAHVNHLWPFFFRPSYAPSTLGRDLSVWWCGHLVALASSDAAPVPKEECLRLRMSTQFLEGMRHCVSMPHFQHPCQCLLHSRSRRRFRRKCFYASWPLCHPPMMSHPSFGQITPVSECGHAGYIPLASSDLASHSLEELGLHTLPEMV